jgi:hypothetical protein
MSYLYSTTLCKNIVKELIKCNKSIYKQSNKIYFYDLADKFPYGTLLDDIMTCFHEEFPRDKISFKDSYIIKNNNKLLRKTGILVKKMQ